MANPPPQNVVLFPTKLELRGIVDLAVMGRKYTAKHLIN